MYYALIDMRASCSAQTTLAWGSLKDISDYLLSECQLLIQNTDDMSMEELEEEYYCEFDNFKKLSEYDYPSFEMVASFSFTLSDCTIDVGRLVEGYPELVKAFDEYKTDKWTLDCWSMVPEIEETDENLAQLDDELRSLNDDLSREDYEFFVEADCEEDDK